MIPVLFVLIVPTRVHSFETGMSQWLKYEAWKNVLQPFSLRTLYIFKIFLFGRCGQHFIWVVFNTDTPEFMHLKLTKFQHYALWESSKTLKKLCFEMHPVLFPCGNESTLRWKWQMNTAGQNIEFWYRPWMPRRVHFNLSFLMDLCQKQNIYAYHQGLKILIV